MAEDATLGLLQEILEEIRGLHADLAANPTATASMQGSLHANGKSPLVPAKCTNCGAPLEVNPAEKAAICPYCEQAYIVDQAINNVSVAVRGDVHIDGAVVNLAGQDTQNLVERAKRFEDACDFAKALEYYEKALDIDVECAEANKGIERTKEKRYEYVFAEEDNVLRTIFNLGTLKLMWGRLVFDSPKKGIEVFSFDTMRELSNDNGYLRFNCPTGTVKLLPKDADRWIDLIVSATKGDYPQPQG